MADDNDDKTEDPTPRRREQAREEGQMAFSAELNGSAVLLGGMITLIVLGPEMGEELISVFRRDLPQLEFRDLTPSSAQNLFYRLLVTGISLLGTYFGVIMVMALIANLAQVGLVISPEKIEPDLEKLDPSKGLSKLFSMASLVKGLLGMVKVVVLGIIAYLVLRRRVGSITSLGGESLLGAVVTAWDMMGRLSLYLVAMLVLVGIVDYFYQKQKFEKSLKMSKQDIKDEMKREEGDPIIKGRIRQLQRDRAKRKMLSQVPKSTVVITNPTHYAVAIKYDPTENQTPVVLARGRGLLAKQIIVLARRHNVPLLERPPLARLLYQSVREGREIPGELFRAVAEVIAFVFRLRGTIR
jgi:flagellar biosynthesis protein FlhB